MRHLKTVLTVIGAVTVLVLAANSVAMATTGHSFLLGKSNSANKATSLSRTTSGSVLNLHSASSSNAPLSVNGHGKVANLNADLVDGLDSSALQNRTYTFTSTVSTAATDVTLNTSVPAGTYLVTYSFFAHAVSDPLGDVGCTVFGGDNSGSKSTAYSEFVTTADFAGLSGAGIITKPATATGFIRLICEAVDTSTFTGVPFTTSDPVQISLTRIDKATTAAAP